MRPLIYGNGTLLVCTDERGVVRDFYYPYVGMENHGGYMRLGLYDSDDRTFGWLEDWRIRQRYKSKFSNGFFAFDSDGEIGQARPGTSLIGETIYENGMGAEVTAWDMVHQNRNVFLRTIRVKNASDEPRNFRLFSSQNYHILENNYANTAVRDGPMLSHYKRDRFFLHSSKPAFDQFTTGISEWGGMQGTWKDAEDGVLAGNVVAHGTVDSTLGWAMPTLTPGDSWLVHLWVCVAENFVDAKEINDWVKARDPGSLYHTVRHYWGSFCSKAHDRGAMRRLHALSPGVREEFERSLLTCVCHMDRGGSIIASCDSQIKQQGADYYTYCWPRDAAWVAIALDKAGYGHLCNRTYRFLRKIIDPRGYFRHKYTPSGSLGSTWHPLPMVQIDETATPIYALYRHWLEERNVMTISSLYEPFVKPAADSLVSFLRDDGLPRPSFDLWEERKGVYTYSCACIYGGLEGAAAIALALGDDESAARWHNVASSVKNAILRELYDEGLGRFRRGLGDDTVDASLFAVWYMGVVPASDRRAAGTMEAIESSLKRPDGGIARYERDGYQGYMNSWPLCTLWLAQWHIRRGEMDKARELLEWCVRHAAPTGLLPEQVGENGRPISVLPLAWSHSTFALAVIEYLEAAKAP